MKRLNSIVRGLVGCALLVSISGFSMAGESLQERVSQRIMKILPGSLREVPEMSGVPRVALNVRVKLEIPKDAKSFLPDYMSQVDKKQLWPMDASVIQERADALAEHFNNYYPNITYHIDWDSDAVNAFAWKSDGERHVALQGGLMRHRAIKIEALALVLAHEIGHHYAGEPTHANGLSCEGVADFWGARVGMRRAYSGRYRRVMDKAIDQTNRFLSQGFVVTISPQKQLSIFKATKGCGHPPAACRIETYQAAVDGRSMPDCAGFISGFNAS